MWRCSCSPSRVLGFRARQHRINERAPPLAPRWFESTKRGLRAPAKLDGFTHALGKRTVPWAPLFFTVLALAPMWRCSCSPSRVLGFRAHQHRINERAPPLAPRWFESTKRGVRAPAKLGRLTHALGKRTVPWAPLFFTVLALAPMWRCSCSPSRVLRFRARQHRINERAPPLAPRWFESTKRVVRAPAKLGRLTLCPRQANGALGSALLHRAGAGSDVALLVFAVACTGFRAHQHRINESAPPLAPRWFESTKRVCARPGQAGTASLRP